MLLSIISAVLLILAFPNFNLSFLVFIGLVPLLFGIQGKPPKKAFWISFFCGFLFYLGVLYWVYHVTVFGLVALCVYLALYFGIFGFLFAVIRSVLAIKILLFIFPLIWIGLEYIQSHLFTGFGWASLGYSQYRNLILIQIADFSGVYGVTFVIVMVNLAIYRALKRSSRELIVALVVLSMVFGYGFKRLNEEEKGSDIKLSVIQGNIPQESKWDPEAIEWIMDRYANLTRMAAFDSPDLIIWPETSFPGFLGADKKLTDEVLGLARKIKIPILLGANTEEGLDIFNSAVLISATGEIIDRYDKIHLVPFGEYVPFSDRLPFLHNLVLGDLGEFTAGKGFRVFGKDRGEKALGLTSGPGQMPSFSVLVCFEDIFPALAERFVQNGARFLVVITNDAWYGKSGAPYQHAACSVFRAIENRIPIVRCANTGYSCFIDSKGSIYASVEEDGEHLFISGHKTSEVKLQASHQ